MKKSEFAQLIQRKRVILDGATGSNLQAAGMPVGVCPEQWILNNKEVLIGLQSEFLKAGTDILYAPTFTGNRIKLAEYGLDDKLPEINRELLALSKEAVARYREEYPEDTRELLVAGDITMTGQQLQPIGPLALTKLIDVYREQIRILCDAGADLLVVETMMSLQECRAALIAAKEVCDLPVMVTLTFGEDGRTLYGTSPETAVVVLESMGADAVGLNCSTGPDRMLPLVEKMQEYAGIPLVVKPNAGLPMLRDGKTVYGMGPGEFAAHMREILKAGAAIVGGCCGTTPEHIRALSCAAAEFEPAVMTKKNRRILTTERTILPIDLEGKFLVIGERINPTGKKALQAELKEGSLELVARMAEEQVKAGADILDINLGMNGIDEKEMLLRVMEEVQGLVDVPLCIDSSHPEIIEEALLRYPGRALINSVSLEPGKMEALLPAAKKYGAMFILLPLSKTGLPKDLEEKKQIIRQIYDAALSCGLSAEDIVVDGLVNTIGANRDAAITALETVRYCKDELGVATVCGLSNISFGLPERQFVNAAFLSFAIQAGITMAILNPAQDLLMNMAYASDLLKNKEEADVRYITRVTEHPVSVGAADVKAACVQEKDAAKKESKEDFPADDRSIIYQAVLKGNRKNIVKYVKEELAQGKTSPDEIINEQLIPAINTVGELFNAKKYFLPQLIASAEAMKTAIEYLEPLLAEGAATEKQGVVVIATVAGDIHDIGKNLVALLMKNYGFEVIDLGKDVPTEEIIRVAKEKDADIIGVSALMTTTMQEMREVVRRRNEEGLRAKVMIGGAVITQSYCDEIGADGYSKDAQEAVEVAKKLLGK